MSENIAYIPVFKRINSYDYSINQFKAYKLWVVEHNTYNSKYNKIGLYQALKPTDIYRNGIIPYSSSKYTPQPNIDRPYTDKTILWSSIEHNFYKQYAIDYNSIYSKHQKLKLYTSASFINIPTLTFGEGIKRGSVKINDFSSYYPISLVDDTFGNIVDTQLLTSSIIDKKNLKLYIGFNEIYDKKHRIISDGSIYNRSLSVVNYRQASGINTTGLITSSTGNSFHLDTTNYLSFSNDEIWNTTDKDDDFSLSFWIKLPVSQSIYTSNYNTIFSKKREGYKMTQNSFTKKQTREYVDLNDDSYPINISVYNTGSNNGKLFFERNDGLNYQLLTSSINLNDNTFHHIVFSKSGSNLKLYIDNSLDVVKTDPVVYTTTNNSDYFIGSEGINRYILTGSIDEFRMYNKPLSDTEVSYLYDNDYITGSAYQNNIVGNVFYKSGNIVISDYRPRYTNVLLGSSGSQNYSSSLYNELESGFSLQFNSTQTIYEHEMVCKIRQDEFNLTLNPTIRVNNKITSDIPKGFVTGSAFNPFITTIGLYDDDYQLLAVAKLSSPIPKIENAPLNFIVRFDT